MPPESTHSDVHLLLNQGRHRPSRLGGRERLRQLQNGAAPSPAAEDVPSFHPTLCPLLSSSVSFCRVGQKIFSRSVKFCDWLEGCRPPERGPRRLLAPFCSHSGTLYSTQVRLEAGLCAALTLCALRPRKRHPRFCRGPNPTARCLPCVCGTPASPFMC